MPECEVCEAFVSADFVRVFGNNDREVHGCPACMTATNILDGEATHPGGAQSK
jgi:hypothetical protein